MSSYIESISQATTAATGASTAKSTKDAVMGKQDFLMLLVAQLQNQDPLNPMTTRLNLPPNSPSSALWNSCSP